MDRIEATCPACGSPRVTTIVQDMPGLGVAELERGRWVALAGCLLGEKDPDRHCRACGYEWIEPAEADSPAQESRSV